jgi:hypothetical protein
MATNDSSGFCISYSVRDAGDKGLGVFTKQSVKRGSIIWRHLRDRFSVYDESSFKEYMGKLSRSEAIYELEHMFSLVEFPDFVILVHDHGVLINHSNDPNVAMNNTVGNAESTGKHSAQNKQDVEDALQDDHFALIAEKDMNDGDELTMNYNIGLEDPLYFAELWDKYEISEPWLS